MEPTAVEYTVDDAVATITLARPTVHNALNVAMAQELRRATRLAAETPSVRCLVIVGSGPAFCAGGDLGGIEDHDHPERTIEQVTTHLHEAVSTMVRMPKPVITAINGVAGGGGLSLAVAGDIAVASSSARFVPAFAQIGGTPDGSFTYFLPRLVGLRRAFDLYYTGRILTAAEAVELGLVTRVFPDAEFATAVDDLARQLASGPTAAFGRAKQLLHQTFRHDLHTQLELEASAMIDSSRTADFRDAVLAFQEKRPPTFSGA